MKSKDFLKKAGAFMENFFSGVKEALGIKPPSSPFDPKPKEGINEAIMREATLAAMKKHPEMNAQQPEVTIVEGLKDAAAIFQRAPEEKTPAQEVADTLKAASLQVGLVGDQAREIVRILGEFRVELSRVRLAKLDRRNTNNWRKMHGLPMRRRTLQERRRKRK